MQLPTLADVRAAAKRIAGYAHVTPCMTSRYVDALTGCTVFFKCENLQRVGAFKFRGACNAVFALSEAEAERGVVTHSSGNHAQALAVAARLRGVRATVVMPTTAPAIKREAVVGYGAEIVDCAPSAEAREKRCAEVQAETGAVLVHPYDNNYVIAGQGTAALELLDQSGPLDGLVAPVGGGGLLSGTALAAGAQEVRPKVFGAEPKAADDAKRSLDLGRRLLCENPQTIADGLRTSLSERTFAVISAGVEDIVCVSEEQIVAAMRMIWERLKIIIEPSSAVAVAAFLAGGLAQEGARVGVILSGGNVDLTALPW